MSGKNARLGDFGRRLFNQAYGSNANTTYTTGKVEEEEIEILVIPKYPEDKHLVALQEVALITGFPTDFSEQAMLMGQYGFVSVRTSAEAIPRGSFMARFLGEMKRLADYKTTSVASKSKLRGACKGKLPMEPYFWNPEKPYSLKDNNSKSMFPSRDPDKQLDDLLPKYNKLFAARGETSSNSQKSRIYNGDIKEIREYNGLIYFSKYVSEYNKKNPDNEAILHLKHYCQEAETLGSILEHITKSIYKEAHIKDSLLDFIDDNNNYCRVDLRYLRPPPDLEVKQSDKILITQADSINALNFFVQQQNNLDRCHIPIFTSITPNDTDSFVPVMVQAGDTGEGIIRDADFEHFYKHPLVPPLAQKTFNGGTKENYDHLDGLELLSLRLNSANLASFEIKLDEFIDDYIESEHFKGAITLDDFYVINMIKKSAPSLLNEFVDHAGESVAGKYVFSDLTAEQKRIILLAKYNDLSTLNKEFPFIDYTIEEFTAYRDAVDAALMYYTQDSMIKVLEGGVPELFNVGEASTQDLVFLHQLGHPMAMHGDDGGHPVMSENFAKITTYCNNKVVITNNETQYLQILLNNPAMLQNQIITIHPAWLKNLDSNDSTLQQLSAGWLDLLTIQALRHGILVAENTNKFEDAIKGYDVFVETIVLNMTRRYASEADAKTIEKVRKMAKDHFISIRNELGNTAEPLDMDNKINAIYTAAQNQAIFNVKQEVKDISAGMGNKSKKRLSV